MLGYRAAELLDRLIAGDPPPEEPIRVPPVGVVTRRSSDVLAIEDSHVAAAMRRINEDACRPLKVPDILRQVPVNRRWLERQFKRTIGRTVGQEILRVRIEKAKQLLLDTELALPEVAAECGFAQAHHLGLMFRRQTGLTPGAYRRAMRR